MDKSAKKRKDHGGKSKHFDKQRPEFQKFSKQANREINQLQKSDQLVNPTTDSNVLDIVQDVLEISRNPVDKFKKREIESNWSKYESPIEEDTSIATNFENLMNAPISTGGHFQFKSERNTQVDFTNEYREYFTLNINKLAKNIETLPFYVRHHLDKNLFTDDEIKTMDQKCTTFEEDCAEKMSKLLQESDKPNYSLITSTKKAKHNTVEVLNAIDDDLDELLNLKSPHNISSYNIDVADTIEEPELTIPKITTLNSRTNLENWLDNLLQ